MEIGVKSDIGCDRQINEDAYYISKKHQFFIIADGVGGCNAGDIASKNAVETAALFLESKSLDKIDRDESVYNILQLCIESVNRYIVDMAQNNNSYQGMGTTMIVSIALSNKIYFAHLGDSRGYLIRGERVTQITDDHTVPAGLYREGKISKDEAQNHPQRHMITKAIGMQEEIKADMYQLELQEGDIIILCTDGLYDKVNAKEFYQVFTNKVKIQDGCDELVRLAISRESKDNITVLALKNGGDC